MNKEIEQPELRFKLLKPEAELPRYAHPDDAGFDVFSTEEHVLNPGERHTFNIGVASEIPSGYCVVLKPKSGLAVKWGIDVLAGVIDAGYRGEWGVILINFGKTPFGVKAGDKIAQGLFLEVCQAKIALSEELSDSSRGQGGFGSTGK